EPEPPPVRREDEVVVARVDLDLAHGHAREIPALELRPASPAVGRDPEAELGPDEEERRLDGVLLDAVRVSPNALLRRHDPLPRLPVIRSAADPGSHVAEGVAGEGPGGGSRGRPGRPAPPTHPHPPPPRA